MKASSFLLAFIGGAIVGGVVGILFAPAKGEDTRAKIAEMLRQKGIKLKNDELNDLVDQIVKEIKPEQ